MAHHRVRTVLTTGLAVVIAAATLTLGTPGVSLAATSQANFSVFMTGEPGDYISYDTAHLWRSGTADRIGVQRQQADELSVNVSGSTWEDDFHFTFAAPRGQTLGKGTYSNAERAHFRTGNHPGLDIGGGGHGCNSVTGSFTVLDYAPDLSRLWITFEQHCDGHVPALVGEIRYNQPRDADLTIAPSGVIWPAVHPHRSGKDAPVTLVNTGTRQLTVSGARVTDGDADFSVVRNGCATIAVGATCAIDVGFRPSQPGARTGTLTINDSSARRVHTVPLSGTGHQGRTTWSLTSDADDPVSQGASRSFSAATDELSMWGDRDELQFEVNPDEAWSTGNRWGAVFKAAPGADLTPGATYTDVVKWTSPMDDRTTGPSMSVSGNSAFCSTIRGSFRLEDLEYDDDDLPSKALVSFEQHCNGATGALRGTIAWRATATDVTPPAAAANLQAQVENGVVTLAWTDPADADWADTVVRRSPGATAPASSAGGSHVYHGRLGSASVTGLAPGVDHSFSVFGTDDFANTSAPVAVTVTGSVVTLAASPTKLSAGSGTSISGRVLTSGAAAPIPGALVKVYAKVRPRTTWSLVATRSTDSEGKFAVAQKPAAITDYRVDYAGTSSRLPAASVARTVLVASRVALVANRTRARKRKPVTFTTSVSPALPGQNVLLQRLTARGWSTVATGRLNSSSRAAFVIKTSRGKYSYRVVKPSTTTQMSGTSATVGVTVR